jgi:hypothetical protein
VQRPCAHHVLWYVQENPVPDAAMDLMYKPICEVVFKDVQEP